MERGSTEGNLLDIEKSLEHAARARRLQRLSLLHAGGIYLILEKAGERSQLWQGDHRSECSSRGIQAEGMGRITL